MDTSYETINMDDLETSIEPVVLGGKRKMSKSKETEKSTNDRWVWTLEMVATLMQSLKEFKHAEEDNGSDFEGDLVRLYSELRIAMSKVFPKKDFGPTTVTYEETDEMTKAELLRYKSEINAEEELKKKGYLRIKAKVKELRQAYRTAVDTGRRSGSGRQVTQQLNIHWDDLREIWGGSPAVTAIEGGITSFFPASDAETSVTSVTSVTNDTVFQEEVEADEGDPLDSSAPEGKRLKKDEDVSLKDQRNKNKNMNKKLSTHQRDMLFYNLAQQEQTERTNQMAVLQKSIDQSNKAMEGMNTALTGIANSISEGLKAVAAAFAPPPPLPQQYLRQSFMHQGPSQIVPGNDLLQQFVMAAELNDENE